MEIPPGGCIKHTEGTYTQVFDADGTLVASSFEATESKYLDADGDVLDSMDPRLNFYSPFGTCEGYEEP